MQTNVLMSQHGLASFRRQTSKSRETMLPYYTHITNRKPVIFITSSFCNHQSKDSQETASTECNLNASDSEFKTDWWYDKLTGLPGCKSPWILAWIPEKKKANVVCSFNINFSQMNKTDRLSLGLCMWLYYSHTKMSTSKPLGYKQARDFIYRTP